MLGRKNRADIEHVQYHHYRLEILQWLPCAYGTISSIFLWVKYASSCGHIIFLSVLQLHCILISSPCSSLPVSFSHLQLNWTTTWTVWFMSKTVSFVSSFNFHSKHLWSISSSDAFLVFSSLPNLGGWVCVVYSNNIAHFPEYMSHLKMTGWLLYIVNFRSYLWNKWMVIELNSSTFDPY